MCQDDADENEELCTKKDPIEILLPVLIGLLLIGCILGEIIYRMDFQDEIGLIQEDHSFNEFLGELQKVDVKDDTLEAIYRVFQQMCLTETGV